MTHRDRMRVVWIAALPAAPLGWFAQPVIGGAPWDPGFDLAVAAILVAYGGLPLSLVAERRCPRVRSLAAVWLMVGGTLTAIGLFILVLVAAADFDPYVTATAVWMAAVAPAFLVQAARLGRSHPVLIPSSPSGRGIRETSAPRSSRATPSSDMGQ